MTRKYTVKSKSQRWPLQVFFNTLNVAGTNAWILCKEATEGISRQEFLFQLGQELATEYQEQRNKIAKIVTDTSTGTSKRKICHIRYCKDNKTD